MIKKIFFSLIILTFGCVSQRSQLKKPESVTLLLKNNDKIKVEALDIQNDKAAFSSKDKKKAYEYGETIDVERIKGIRLEDGSILAVSEYQDYIKTGQIGGEKMQTSSAKRTALDFHYEQIKDKRISEMTDNEFKYFLLIKEKGIDVKPMAIESDGFVTTNSHELNDVANSLTKAGAASIYWDYLNERARLGGNLTLAESELLDLLTWQKKLEELHYSDAKAQRAFWRAFFNNTESLKTELGLKFDEYKKLDYYDLMEQLHLKLGDRASLNMLRVLNDVFGESGGKAIMDINENYTAWQQMLNERNVVIKN